MGRMIREGGDFDLISVSKCWVMFELELHVFAHDIMDTKDGPQHLGASINLMADANGLQ